MFWAITGLSVVGVVLNIYKNRWGFAFWMVSNAAWAGIDFYKGIPEQGALFVVYFITSLWGFLFWATQGQQKESVSCVSKIS